MAASINKVILIGRVGGDPEVRYTPNGNAVANFTMATNDYYSDKTSGEKQERTEWHRLVVWGKQAEFCGQYVHKGSALYIEGRLQTRAWDDKEGNKRYTTEIIVQSIQLLGSKGDHRADAPGEEAAPAMQQQSYAAKPAAPKSQPAKNFDFGPPPLADDDIPF